MTNSMPYDQCITLVRSVMFANVFVYGKLRFCVRGFSEGKSDVTKEATTFKFSLK